MTGWLQVDWKRRLKYEDYHDKLHSRAITFKEVVIDLLGVYKNK